MLVNLLQDNFGQIHLFYRLWVILQVWWKQWSHILSYNHRRLAACDANSVTSGWKDDPIAYGQQYVGNIANIAEKLFYEHFPLWLTGCESHWCLWMAHLFLLPTGSEWYCKLCEKQSHNIFSYDQQRVSEIAHFVKASLIASCYHMTNSL